MSFLVVRSLYFFLPFCNKQHVRTHILPLYLFFYSFIEVLSLVFLEVNKLYKVKKCDNALSIEIS